MLQTIWRVEELVCMYYSQLLVAIYVYLNNYSKPDHTIDIRNHLGIIQKLFALFWISVTVPPVIL
jgi:hypothetical protein